MRDPDYVRKKWQTGHNQETILTERGEKEERCQRAEKNPRKSWDTQEEKRKRKGKRERIANGSACNRIERVRNNALFMPVDIITEWRSKEEKRRKISGREERKWKIKRRQLYICCSRKQTRGNEVTDAGRQGRKETKVI